MPNTKENDWTTNSKTHRESTAKHSIQKCACTPLCLRLLSGPRNVFHCFVIS